jgi:hypothetical protein
VNAESIPETSGQSERIRRAVALLLAVLVLAWGGAAAYVQRWTTDDAFISFRYARNLIEGHGLVFNAGELVEGYSNFLWTLWSAAGLALGFAAESWASFWGVVAYLGCIVLLLLNHRRLAQRARAAWILPVAAAGGALHPDWNVFATSGLETTLFTLLILAGFLIVSWNPHRAVDLMAAGLLLGLAALTRPDGLLPAGVIGILVFGWARSRVRSSLAYGLGFAVVWLPYTLWRLHYYGEFFPNTYYAKSAYLSWYAQGWHYLELYLERYWALLAGPPLLVLAATLGGGQAREATADFTRICRRQVLGAAAIAAAYTWFVLRVGGDFMFARMLIPATPFYLLLLELGLLQAFQRKRLAGCVASIVLLAAVWLTPAPVSGTEWRHGVANERLYYSRERVAELDHWAEVLGRYFDGLNVRVAFYGDEARIVYRARFPIAIESHTGLTDPLVARLELERRGRPGHEKLAPVEYLIDEREVHFTFSEVPRRRLRELIPEIIVRFDDRVYGQVLHWEPELMAALGERGARFPDFTAYLDRVIAQLDGMPDERVGRIFERLERFYFRRVDDPVRESAFRTRLEAAAPPNDG